MQPLNVAGHHCRSTCQCVFFSPCCRKDKWHSSSFLCSDEWRQTIRLRWRNAFIAVFCWWLSGTSSMNATASPLSFQWRLFDFDFSRPWPNIFNPNLDGNNNTPGSFELTSLPSPFEGVNRSTSPLSSLSPPARVVVCDRSWVTKSMVPFQALWHQGHFESKASQALTFVFFPPAHWRALPFSFYFIFKYISTTFVLFVHREPIDKEVVMDKNVVFFWGGD